MKIILSLFHSAGATRQRCEKDTTTTPGPGHLSSS